MLCTRVFVEHMNTRFCRLWYLVGVWGDVPGVVAPAAFLDYSYSVFSAFSTLLPGDECTKPSPRPLAMCRMPCTRLPMCVLALFRVGRFPSCCSGDKCADKYVIPTFLPYMLACVLRPLPSVGAAATDRRSGCARRAPSPTPPPRGDAPCARWAPDPRGWGVRSLCPRAPPSTRTGTSCRKRPPSARRCAGN